MVINLGHVYLRFHHMFEVCVAQKPQVYIKNNVLYNGHKLTWICFLVTLWWHEESFSVMIHHFLKVYGKRRAGFSNWENLSKCHDNQRRHTQTCATDIMRFYPSTQYLDKLLLSWAITTTLLIFEARHSAELVQLSYFIFGDSFYGLLIPLMI